MSIFNRIVNIVNCNITHQLNNRENKDYNTLYTLKSETPRADLSKKNTTKANLKYSSEYEDYLRSEKGKQGEHETEEVFTKAVSGRKIIWSNLIIENDNKSTEIDLILINHKGVFVIENKNYNGSVYGSEYNKEWSYYLNNQKYSFYNPIMQNATHIRYLQELLFDKLSLRCNYYNVVVFSSSNKVKVSYNNPNVFVGDAIGAANYINSVSGEQAVSDEQIDRIINYFAYVHDKDRLKMEKHINNVKR